MNPNDVTSINIQVTALQLAVGVHAKDTTPLASGVVATAQAFADFIRSGTGIAVVATQPAATQPAAPQPAATQPAATQPAAPQPAATPPAALEYDRDVKAPMMELARVKGRPVVTAIFAKFSGEDGKPIKQATALKHEQWPAFIAAVNAAMADPSIPSLVA